MEIICEAEILDALQDPVPLLAVESPGVHGAAVQPFDSTVDPQLSVSDGDPALGGVRPWVSVL